MAAKLLQKEKDFYADKIAARLKKIKEELPRHMYIPILQVAYRFKFENQDENLLYVEFPYNDTIERQNRDLRDKNKPIYKVDNIFFRNLINNDKETGLKYVLYEYVEENNENIIVDIETTIKRKEDEKIKKALINGFSVVRYGATLVGDYNEVVSFKNDYNRENIKTKKILFIVDKFQIDAMDPSDRPFTAHITATFELKPEDDFDNGNLKERVEYLVFLLKMYGETILTTRRWDELEKEKIRYEIIKENTDRIEAHRHTLLNLINAFSYQLDELPEQYNLLKNGANFAFSITKDICSKHEDRNTVWDKFPDKPEKILRLLHEYFGSNKFSQLKPNFYFEESLFILRPLERYSYFTIMYNLIHNAEKSNGYDNYNGSKIYTVNSYQKDNCYITEIVTPAVMKEELTNFINHINCIDDLDLFDFENSFLKPKGGIAISKKLAIRNSWNLNVKNDHSGNTNTLITTITINLNSDGIN